MISKNELRSIYINRRNALTQEEIKQKSSIIHKKLLSSEFYLEANIIFSYVSMGSEVLTKPIIEAALKSGKIIAVPVVLHNRREIVFVRIQNFESLQKSKFGILEPAYNTCDIIRSNKETINIIPGIVFDRQRNRIGYGAGYYDKYLSQNEFLKKIGICYAEQILDSFNNDSHDISMDIIITDKEDIYE